MLATIVSAIVTKDVDCVYRRNRVDDAHALVSYSNGATAQQGIVGNVERNVNVVCKWAVFQGPIDGSPLDEIDDTVNAIFGCNAPTHGDAVAAFDHDDRAEVPTEVPTCVAVAAVVRTRRGVSARLPSDEDDAFCDKSKAWAKASSFLAWRFKP